MKLPLYSYDTPRGRLNNFYNERLEPFGVVRYVEGENCHIIDSKTGLRVDETSSWYSEAMDVMDGRKCDSRGWIVEQPWYKVHPEEAKALVGVLIFPPERNVK